MKQILSFFLGFALGAMAVYLIVENRKAREERAEELALEYVDSIINWAFDKAEEIEAEEIEAEVYEAEEASYFRMFDKPGDCVDGSYFQVEKVLDEHYAIAQKQEYYASANLYVDRDLYVLFYSEEENKFYDDLIELSNQANNPKEIAKIRKSLPIFIISGSDDPVGGYSKGVRKVYSLYRKAGIENVQMKLYDGGRHEILNEINKDEVFEDVVRFYDSLM